MAKKPPLIYKTKPTDLDNLKPGQWITLLGPNLRYFPAHNLSDDPDGTSANWSLDPNTRIALHPGTANFYQLIGIPMKIIEVMDPLIQCMCFNSFRLPICIRIFDTRSIAIGPCSKRWVSRFFNNAEMIELVRKMKPELAEEGIPAISGKTGWISPSYTEETPTLNVEANPPEKPEEGDPQHG